MEVIDFILSKAEEMKKTPLEIVELVEAKKVELSLSLDGLRKKIGEKQIFI